MARTRNTTTAVATTTATPAVRKATASPALPPVAPYRVVAQGATAAVLAAAVAAANNNPNNRTQGANEFGATLPQGRANTGQHAMALYMAGRLYNGTPLPLQRYGTTDANAPTNPTELARAIAARAPGTPNGLAWGPLAATFGVTERCARMAYNAAAPGNDFARTGKGGWAYRNA